MAWRQAASRCCMCCFIALLSALLWRSCMYNTPQSTAKKADANCQAMVLALPKGSPMMIGTWYFCLKSCCRQLMNFSVEEESCSSRLRTSWGSSLLSQEHPVHGDVA